MKSQISTLLLTLSITGSSLFGAEAANDIVLRGILDSGDTQVFSISASDGQSSSWVKVGQNYKGYQLKGFDAESKTLKLSKEGKDFTLNLEAKKETTAPTTGDPKKRLAEAQKIMNMINFEEMIGDSLDVQIESIKKMMQQQMMAQDPNADPNNKAFQKKMKTIENMFKNIDWKPIETGLTEVYAETFTQTELEAISSFYASPAGQSTLEKAPEIQRKMSELMMPAVMQATQQAMMQAGQ
ncbi:MAG: DUF2059 domain-containing protein [Opitutales bacterium]